MAAIPKRKQSSPEKPLSTKYKIVCWDVDPTGRRLIDEICQIAAYTPEVAFQQYIMPYRDVDFLSKKRHQIRTVTVGRYRVLKEARPYGSVLKTKSELYGLVDFLDWIDSIKGDQRIVLVTFEQYKLAPCLLIEGLKRYNLLERFSECVSGFANAYHFVKQKCELSMSSFSLRTLAKILLNKEQEEIFSAQNRAKLTYEILEHLCTGEFEEDEPCPPLRAVQPHLNSVQREEEELDEFKASLILQNTLKPIFSPLLRDAKMRKRATALRSYLTNAHICFEDLKQVFEQGQEKLKQFVEEKIEFTDTSDATELLTIIKDHFKSDATSRGGNGKRNVRKTRKFSRYDKIQQNTNPVEITNNDENSNTNT